MAHNLDVRMLSNGHPIVYVPNVPPFPPPMNQMPPQVPVIAPTPPIQQFPPPAPLSPRSQLAQLQQLQIQQQHMDPLLNPSALRLPPPTIGINPYVDILSGQLPLLPQIMNPFMFPMNLPFVPIPPFPPPLMSLHITKPPTIRAHPYEAGRDRADNAHRRPRNRNNSHNKNDFIRFVPQREPVIQIDNNGVPRDVKQEVHPHQVDRSENEGLARNRN
ncbi:Protein CBG15580 [Caenorhabditis briggsae]|uniref:Protein CBG15580 n=2 Tax=Caenorhabditis briggsae TaxID=6238 RepID=A8XM38_CAEBR|nr:Protein CBG15580 [Caenorhabditis briggsae]ULT83735.1 hypothetical protein L3Y34_012770 [Caenorhabditis briggsae]CAP33713.1 Protein CBG15580 [Caenorhabditis briggsae]